MQAVMDQRTLTEWACTGCGTVQPAEKFKSRGTAKKDSKAPRHTMCNRCLYLRYTRPHAQKKTEAVQQFKLERGCADCGYAAHPAALEFDHRLGEVKLFNVMEKVGSYSMEAIWSEIAKCDVVCANCHAVRTATRRVGVV